MLRSCHAHVTTPLDAMRALRQTLDYVTACTPCAPDFADDDRLLLAYRHAVPLTCLNARPVGELLAVGWWWTADESAPDEMRRHAPEVRISARVFTSRDVSAMLRLDLAFGVIATWLAATGPGSQFAAIGDAGGVTLLMQAPHTRFWRLEN